MARPKGRPKLGGRQKGTRNKASVARERAVAASGITPLDYMLKVMRNPKAEVSRRDWAAKEAAPYIHPKLATLQSNVNLTGRLTLEALVTNSLESANSNVVAGLVDITPTSDSA